MVMLQLTSEIEVPNDDVTGTGLFDDGDYWVDGVAVTERCYHFCIRLRQDRAFMGCKFGMNHVSHRPVSSMFVYFPDEIYCRGTIGYGDIGVESFINKYYVEAEGINNRKIRPNKRQYSMLGRDNITKGVKLAKQYLRKKSIEQVVDNTAYKLSQSLSAEKDCKTEAEDAAMDLLHKQLSRNGALTAELANMVRTDYEFKNEAVRESIVAYMDTIDDEIVISSRNIRIALVLVHPPHTLGASHEVTVQRGRTHLNLAKRVYAGDITRALQGSMEETYTPETLPEDIAQKLATLNVIEGHTYVEGVGCRHSENVYYIAEDV